MSHVVSDYAVGKDMQIRLIVNMVHNLDLIQYARNVMKLDDFDLPACRAVFEALTDYVEKYAKLPAYDVLMREVQIVVTNARGLSKTVLAPEEYESLGTLMQMVVQHGPLDPAYYKHEIIDYIKHVRVKKEFANMGEALAAGMGANEIIQKISELSDLKPSAGIQLSSALEEPEALTDRASIRRISTGLTVFDNYFNGGLGVHELGLLTACPGVGKTNTLLNFAVGACLQGWHVLFITLEMPSAAIKRRYQAMIAHIYGNLMMKPIPEWPESDIRRFKAMTESPIAGNMIVAHMSDKKHSVHDVEEAIVSWLAYEQQRYGNTDRAKLVLIDWLDMIKPDRVIKDKSDMDWTVLRAITEDLGRMGRKHDVACWTATQATKEAEGATRPGMRHTAFAYHKNDYVHISMVITSPFTDAYKNNFSNDDDVSQAHLCRRMLQYTIVKNRDGALGIKHLFQGPTLRLYQKEEHFKDADRLVQSGAWDLLFQQGTPDCQKVGGGAALPIAENIQYA
jgi:replicative DNA helicase